MPEPATHDVPRRIRPMLGEFVSNGWASGVLEEGPGMIALAVVMGAFIGLILGLITMQFARFLSFAMGRNLGGASWALISMALGAVAFGIIAATDKD